MTSLSSSHSRGQSTASTSPAPTSTRFFSNNQSTHPSLNDTAYNGSEGHIDGRVHSFELDQEDYQSSSSRVSSPRPTLGGRFLSSLSNAQPAAAALGRKGSLLQSRAKSLAAFVPKLNANNQSTPERPPAANRLFQSFFDGESAPIRIGPPVSPSKEKEEIEFVVEYRPSFTERPRTLPRRQSNAPSMMSTPSSTKTSWFGRKSTAPAPARQQPTYDELATLNINSALFPHGPADPLNPSAFNDLLLNATALLTRMQSAYREKTEYMATVQPEMDAQLEEVEETETRNAHLKLQLEDLGRRAQEQDLVIREMAEQVQAAKIEAEEAREAAKTIRLVREGEEGTSPARRRKRASAASASVSDSDSGFESDLDSVVSAAGTGEGRMWLVDRQLAAGQRRGEGEGLREENAALRAQVAEMQRTIDGCIEFVGMLKG